MIDPNLASVTSVISSAGGGGVVPPVPVELFEQENRLPTIKNGTARSNISFICIMV
jgi:hypothetical protein